MLAPEALLNHASRILAGAPDEADARRAVSACYYAVFNLLIVAAAETQAAAATVQDAVRRSVQHREVRRVCEAMVARPASRPVGLQRLLVEPVDGWLIEVARIFVDLQLARLEADYDLVVEVTPANGLLVARDASAVFAVWPTLLPDPNTRTFLLALLFHERWTRRT